MLVQADRNTHRHAGPGASRWPGWIGIQTATASSASPAALARLQSQRLAALLQSAREGSPLYAGLIGQREPREIALSDLPVMTKHELMRHFDEWVCDRRLCLPQLRRFMRGTDTIGKDYLGRYVLWESSGSSGETGIFVQDAGALAVYEALESLRRPVLQPLRRWIDPFYVSERIAFVGATEGHYAATASVRRLCRLNPWLAARMRSFSFLQPVPSLVAQLNAQRPTVLGTYPTAALMLAEEAAAGRLKIALREVWTGGEALTPAMRSFIGKSLGCPVTQSYGASEFLAMASECRCGSLHVNSDWVILESVDESRRAVPPGQPGATTLLTNLANHVQPLIRYDLGDRITVHGERCACGSHLPRIEVQGRADDSLLMRDPGGRSVRLLPLALTTVLEEEARVFDFQLVQQDPQSLLLRVAAGGNEGVRQMERAREALGAYLRAQGLPGVTLDVRCGEAGERPRSGKAQRVVAPADA